MKCLCCDKKSETIIGLCNDCYSLKEAFYYDEIIKFRDKAKKEKLEDLQDVSEMLKECDCPRYVENQSFSKRINDIIKQLKELDLIRENTNL